MTPRDATKEPCSLAELFASWGPVQLINPHEPRAFTKLAARYADLLQLIHRLEARCAPSAIEPVDTRTQLEKNQGAIALLDEWIKESAEWRKNATPEEIKREEDSFNELMRSIDGNRGVRAVAAPINQCDGCRRGLPIENGMHRLTGIGCYTGEVMGCTADRYIPAAQGTSEDAKDAARYRWLREHQYVACVWADTQDYYDHELLQREALDAAIDAAMNTKTAPEGK